MTPALQSILIVFLIIVGGFLVPFLIQYRKTLKALESFARSAEENLDSITESIRQISIHTNEVLEMAKETLSLPAKLSRLISSFINVMPTLLGSQSSIVAMVDGFKTARKFFRRTKKEEV
jgi:predicted PurR-regulated permease PerM